MRGLSHTPLGRFSELDYVLHSKSVVPVEIAVHPRTCPLLVGIGAPKVGPGGCAIARTMYGSLSGVKREALEMEMLSYSEGRRERC